MRCACRPVLTNKAQTVQQQLTTTFRRYGLPQAFFVDNGSPWGDPSGRALDQARRLATQARCRLCASQALPSAEPRQERAFPSHAEGRGVRTATLSRSGRAAARLRRLARASTICERPHEALGQEVPASRYRPSPRAMPDRCPRSNTTATRPCAVSPPPRPISASRAAVEGPGGFLRRTPRHPAARPTADYGVFFGAHQIATHRLDDQKQKCRLCLRTGVGYLPGLNIKSGDDGGVRCAV